MAYTPSPNKAESGKTNFGGSVVDANRVALNNNASNFITQDITGTPVTSPTTVNTATTLVVPLNAVACTIVSVTNPVDVSEDSTTGEYFALPAAVPMTFPCTRQANIYLKTGSSTVVSFFFSCV